MNNQISVRTHLRLSSMLTFSYCFLKIFPILLCLNITFIISDLPKGSQVHNLGALTAFYEKKLPNIKQLGKSIIREFQQVMFKEWSSQERAVISKDLAQRLLVRVCICFICFAEFQTICLQLHIDLF